jgi:hypothetical protein
MQGLTLKHHLALQNITKYLSKVFFMLIDRPTTVWAACRGSR